MGHRPPSRSCRHSGGKKRMCAHMHKVSHTPCIPEPPLPPQTNPCPLPRLKSPCREKGHLGLELGRLKGQSSLGDVTCPLVRRQVRKVTKGLLTRPCPSEPLTSCSHSHSQHLARGMGRRPHSSWGCSGGGESWMPRPSVHPGACPTCLSPHVTPHKLCRHPYPSAFLLLLVWEWVQGTGAVYRRGFSPGSDPGLSPLGERLVERTTQYVDWGRAEGLEE